jgi:hypothetical protein
MKTKHNVKLSVVFTTCYLLLTTPCGYAAEINPNAGTTSATFLTLGVGSRATAMGGAFCGLADDVTALYWNPAGLARLANTELHVTDNEQFEGLRQDFAGFATPLGKGVIGGALYGLTTPDDIERRSSATDGNPFMPLSSPEGLFGAYDIAGQVSYARVLKDRLSVGANLLFISQTIDNYTADGAAVDLGVQYGLKNKPISLGFVLQHMGTPIKFISQSYELPFNVKAGAAWFPKQNLKVTCDLNQPVDNWLSTAVGSEYFPNKFIAIRAGYNYLLYGNPLGDLAGFSAGVGFVIPLEKHTFTIDYAYQPYGVLGNANRISVGIEFSAPAVVHPAPSRTAVTMPAQVNISTSSAITVLSPVLPVTTPAAAPAAAAASSTTTFTTFKTSTTVELMQISGRTATYSIVSDGFADCDLRRLSATAESKAALNTALTVSFSQDEKPSVVKNGLYRHYLIESSYPVQLSNVNIEINLPASLVGPSALLQNGTAVPLKLIAKDVYSALYQFALPSLQPFSVQTHE